MAYYNKRIIRHQQVTISYTDAGAFVNQWLTPIPLVLLGIRGEIRHVKCRLDVGGPAGTLDLYVADQSLSPMTTGVPKDEDVFYANVGAGLTASATAASIADNPAATGGALYEVTPLEGPTSNLAVGMRLSGAAGTYDLLIDVWAEVQL